MTHVALVGMPGTGKSSVAELLGASLGMPWSDLDAMVEDAAGMPVTEVFTTAGEDRFRQIEHACLAELVHDATPTVIACGGGVVVREDNRTLLHRPDVTVVFLTASAATIEARLAGERTSRPLLASPDAVAELWHQRRAMYLAVADMVIDTDRHSVAEVAQITGRRLEDEGWGPEGSDTSRWGPGPQASQGWRPIVRTGTGEEAQ